MLSIQADIWPLGLIRIVQFIFIIQYFSNYFINIYYSCVRMGGRGNARLHDLVFFVEQLPRRAVGEAVVIILRGALIFH